MERVRRSACRKRMILDYAAAVGKIMVACRELEVPGSSFYRWRRAYAAEGVVGLRRKRPVGKRWPNQLSPEAVAKVLELRREYHLGPQRIVWYLERYHGIKISSSSAYRTLIRNGVGPLPKKAGRRALHTRRYAKEVPGHHVQVDVKFLSFKTEACGPIRRFQYTAIDNATRVRALKIYPQHSLACAIDFIDYVVEKFPFRVHTIRTGRGHEFQAQFHWHSKTRECGTFTSSPEPRSSTARSSDAIDQIRPAVLRQRAGDRKLTRPRRGREVMWATPDPLPPL